MIAEKKLDGVQENTSSGMSEMTKISQYLAIEFNEGRETLKWKLKGRWNRKMQTAS